MKKLMLALALFWPLGLCAEQNPSAAHCIESGKALFNTGKLDAAQAVFLDCYSLDPANTDILLSLGGIYLSQNNLPAAKSFFEKTVDLLPRTSPYNAYALSRLGDIYFKQGNYNQAKSYYARSIRFNYSNVNSVIGYGVILEYEGNALAAARYYKTALAVEPYNPIARENYRRLEPLIFTQEEVLDALKIRLAAAPDKTTLTARDVDLFYKIHRAEQSMGVEYLQDKYKNNPPPGMIIETGTGTPELRFMLSLKGYNEIMRIMSLEAVKYFQAAGVNPNATAKLRDLNGLAVFDTNNLLTETGITVYSKALEGKKSFLLPGEPVPAILKETNAQVKKILNEGYVEISTKEYEYVRAKTHCSEKTLVNSLGVKIFTTPQIRRFVKKTTDLKQDGLPYYYAMEYRATAQDGANAPVYSSFFGTKAIDSVTLCDNKGNLAG